MDEPKWRKEGEMCGGCKKKYVWGFVGCGGDGFVVNDTTTTNYYNA